MGSECQKVQIVQTFYDIQTQFLEPFGLMSSIKVPTNK